MLRADDAHATSMQHVRALSLLVRVSERPGAAQRLLESDGDGVAVLVALLTAPTADSAVRSRAALALGHASRSEPQVATSAIAGGALPALMAMLKSGTEKEQEGAATAISELLPLLPKTTHDATVLGDDTLEIYLDLLKSGNPSAQLSVLRLVESLVDADERAAPRLAAVGVIAPLLRLVHADAEAVRAASARVVAALARDVACRALLVAVGAVETLMKAAPAPEDDFRAQADRALDVLRPAAH
ncbi:hypothetical protein PINS_up021603 [Pythium insidiosum]|nr:hypothetical protein PINS_up021603 [Pythium insidiosum]